MEDSFRLSADQHRQFILRALAITHNPHLALYISRKAINPTANVFLMSIANSGQVSKALHLLSRYNRVFTHTLSIRPTGPGDEVGFEITSHLDDPTVGYFAVSSFILFLDLFFMDALNGAHLVRHAELAFPRPEGSHDVIQDYGFSIAFDKAATRIYLDPALVDAPLKQADPQTVKLLVDMCERQLRLADVENSIVGTIRSVLIDHISAPPTLEQMALALNFSPRSLRRKLHQSGTTYQKVLDSMRLELATKLLRETREPVSSIAYELGFASASHFGRAFKKWTGHSPSTHRNS